jgi:hypothetical protein
MKRVSGMLSVHPQMHGRRGRPSQEVSDVLRGALVLALAALDALVTDTILTNLPALVRKGRLSEAIVDWLGEKANRQAAALCFGDSVPGRALTQAIHASTLTKSTYQRPQVIEKALRAYCDCEPDWGAIAAALTQRNGGRRTWTTDQVKGALNGIVDRRDRIAHQGDVAEGKSSATPIRLSYVLEAQELILITGRHVYKCATDHVKTL